MRARARTLATLAAVAKLAFGGLEVVTGLAWLTLSSRAAQDWLLALIEGAQRQQPDNPALDLARRELEAAFAHPTLAAFVLIGLGLVKLAGAAGFLSGRNAGYWLFVGSVAVLLPVDAVQAARDGSPLAVALLCLNVAVLVLLLRYRVALSSPAAAA